MTSLGDAAAQLKEVVLNLKAPAVFGLDPSALRSPVDIACAVVKWSAALEDDEVAEFDPAFAQCCRDVATAVRDYRLHGLERAASAFLSRLPAPVAKNAPPEKAAAVEEGANDANRF